MGLLRLLLALAVVAAHAGPPAGVPWLVMTGGPVSVQVFYVISGFYMTLILTEKYVGEGALVAFAKSRLLRLVPMFLCVVIATMLVALLLHACCDVHIAPLERWRAHGSSMPWADWLLLHVVNFTIVGQDAVSFFAVDPATGALFFTPDFHEESLPAWQFLWLPQGWTIGVELMFYAVAPFLVRRHVAVIALVVLASLGLRVFVMRTFHVYNDPWTYRFFPTELALFLTGALAFHAYRWFLRWGVLRPACSAIATLVMCGLVVCYRLLPDELLRAPFGLPLLLLVLPILLPFVFHGTKQNRFDRALGELSYPVYLIHYLLVFVVAASGVPWLFEHRALPIMATTLALAFGLWRWVGQPLEARRQHLGAGLRRGPSATRSTAD